MNTEVLPSSAPAKKRYVLPPGLPVNLLLLTMASFGPAIPFAYSKIWNAATAAFQPTRLPIFVLSSSTILN